MDKENLVNQQPSKAIVNNQAMRRGLRERGNNVIDDDLMSPTKKQKRAGQPSPAIPVTHVDLHSLMKKGGVHQPAAPSKYVNVLNLAEPGANHPPPGDANKVFLGARRPPPPPPCAK